MLGGIRIARLVGSRAASKSVSPAHCRSDPKTPRPKAGVEPPPAHELRLTGPVVRPVRLPRSSRWRPALTMKFVLRTWLLVPTSVSLLNPLHARASDEIQ